MLCSCAFLITTTNSPRYPAKKVIGMLESLLRAPFPGISYDCGLYCCVVDWGIVVLEMDFSVDTVCSLVLSHEPCTSTTSVLNALPLDIFTVDFFV